MQHNNLCTSSYRYIKAVQMSTLDSVPKLLTGYMGYTSSFYGMETESISLRLYANPQYVARFVGYLQAREVGIGQIAKHVGLARKVNDYLQSGAADTSAVRRHAAKMEAWLATLLAQLHASTPSQPKAHAQDIELTWRWVEQLVDSALSMIDNDMRSEGSIGHRTACRILQAIVASFVTGCYCPPCRIHVLLSLIHPRFNGRFPCTDRDCVNGDGCLGNHLQLLDIPSAASGSEGDSDSSWGHFGYKATGVRLAIVHHKNDRYELVGSW